MEGNELQTRDFVLEKLKWGVCYGDGVFMWDRGNGVDRGGKWDLEST